MRTLLPLFILVATVTAAEPVGDLLSTDPETRARAEQRILEVGTPALKSLVELREGSKEEAARARISKLIREIEKREPGGLRFRCALPSEKTTVASVNGRDFRLTVTVTNLSDETHILYPYLALRVLDANGNPVKFSRHLGRSGRRAPGNPLEHVKFVSLKPGESWTVPCGIAQYMLDPRWINGWKIPEAGTYTLEFTYAFDRAAAKKLCDPDWKRLHSPNEAWNRAVAVSHTFSTRMQVD